MATAKNCPICHEPRALKWESKFYPDGGFYSCTKCGKYHITMSAKVDLTNQSYDDKRFILSGVTRNANERGIELRIDGENLDEHISTAPRFEDVLMRLDHLLLHMSRQEGALTGLIKFILDNDYPIIYAKDRSEFGYVLSLGQTVNQLESKGPGAYAIAPDGWRRVQERYCRAAGSQADSLPRPLRQRCRALSVAGRRIKGDVGQLCRRSMICSIAPGVAFG